MAEARAVRVTGGVNQYPDGVDCDNGVERVTIATLICMANQYRLSFYKIHHSGHKLAYMSLIRILLMAAGLSSLIACDEAETTAQPDTPVEVAAPSSAVRPSSDSEYTPGDEDEGAPDQPIPEQNNRLQGTLLQETWTGDLDVLEKQRVIRILTVYSIGRYYLDGAVEKGLVYELGKRFEGFVNKKLKRGPMKVQVMFIPVARNQLLPALLEGRGDIIAASLSITPERQQLIDFSKPISRKVSEILVIGPAAPPIESLDDLAGKTLYVRHSSSYRESVEELNRRFAEEGKALVKIEPVSEMLEDDDLIEMVNAGLLPWAIVDDYKTTLWAGVFTDLVVRDDIVFHAGGRLAWAFRKNSPMLKAQINRFLKSHRQGSLIGNILTNRYIRDFDWASNALTDRDYERFEKMLGLFKKYAEQYGIDYLMVAAQGYQESRLDQSARSRAGAVGIMQMLPSTAKGPMVGIPNIHKVEPNIHAGVKYLGYLRDRYFSDPDIDQLNRILLALAAYNTGPRRMINLRNKAAKRGYDPNQWFDNVEVIAAKDIGRETVQYVSNIYKYYLAYRLMAEQQMQRHTARQEAGID